MLLHSEIIHFSFGKRSSTTQTDGSARRRTRRDRSAPAAAEQRRSNGVCENESIDFHRAREVKTISTLTLKFYPM